MRRRVAVQDLGPDVRPRGDELAERFQLILLQGLGGKQEEGPRLGVVRSVSRTGSWYPRLLPEAVPVTIRTSRPARAGRSPRPGACTAGRRRRRSGSRRARAGADQVGEPGLAGGDLFEVDQVPAAPAPGNQPRRNPSSAGIRRPPGRSSAGERLTPAPASLSSRRILSGRRSHPPGPTRECSRGWRLGAGHRYWPASDRRRCRTPFPAASTPVRPRRRCREHPSPAWPSPGWRSRSRRPRCSRVPRWAGLPRSWWPSASRSGPPRRSTFPAVIRIFRSVAMCHSSR